jgi:hypothetical protein
VKPSMSIRRGVRIGCGLLLLALAGPAVAADSMRCGSRLVATGDSAAKLLGVCGEPALRDAWQAPGGYGLGTLAEVEEWTYNFGPQQLLRLVRLRQGRIERIEAEGYGFHASGRRDCSPSTAIARGMSKYRLLTHCGEPLTRIVSHRLLRRPPRYYGGGFGYHAGDHVLEAVHREEWTYNFGSSKLMRLVTLDNGVVSDVRTGERGFDR